MLDEDASHRTADRAEAADRDGAQHTELMGLYERFEHIVAVALSAVIAVIVVVALFQLLKMVFYLVVTQSLNPLEHDTFQAVFGMVMTLLIALEFKHSIIKVAFRRESIIQVKTVVLIALIALARKFVILDVDAGAGKIAALALALLSLGIVYWLMRERDDNRATREQVGHGSPTVRRNDPPLG